MRTGRRLTRGRLGIAATATIGAFLLGITSVAASPAARSSLLPDVTIKIVNEHSGLCLGISGASTQSAAHAVQQLCANVTYQNWVARNVEISGNYTYYKFINVNSGLYLGVAGSSTADNADVDQFTYSSGYHQQWWVSAYAGHTYLVNRNSGKCLEVQGDSTAAQALAKQLTCDGVAHVGEAWTFPTP